MNVLQDNLTVEWVRRPQTKWEDSIVSMAEGYPFEKTRRSLWPDPAQLCRSTWRKERGGTARFLVARYGDRPVGWLQVSNLPGATPDGSPIRLVQWELIQRNRNDLRRTLMRTLLRDKSDRPVIVEQPTQNRTARQCLRRIPGFRARDSRTIMARREDDPPSHPGPHAGEVSVQRLPDKADLRETRDRLTGPVLAGFQPDRRLTYALNHLIPDGSSTYQSGVLRNDEGRVEGCIVVSGRGPGRVPCAGMGRIEHLWTDPAADSLRTALRLVEWAEAWFSAHGCVYREASVNNDDTPGARVLRRFNYRPVSRRIRFMAGKILPSP